MRSARDVVARVAAERRLDAAADGALSRLGRLATGRSGRLLRGDWLGHAFHPLATDFTAGPWMAASFLDLFGPSGTEDAARRLVGLGLLAAVPTWLSGAVEWQATRGPERRVGLLHAAGSTLATALYGASYLARRSGRRRPGIVLGVAGGLVELLDGYVGGDLSLVSKVGTGRRPAVDGVVVATPGSLPELDTLDEVAGYVSEDAFVRFSRGPEHDRDSTSRDYESGLALPGLSVTALNPPAWWDRPLEDWLARQICKYVHLEKEADDHRFGWLLRGRTISRGPDGEPLVDQVVPLARLTDEVLVAARRRYRERFEVGEDST